MLLTRLVCLVSSGQDGLDFREFLAFICIGFLLGVIPQARGTQADNASHALRLCTDAFWLLDRNHDGIITKAELDAQEVSEAFRGVRFGQMLRSVHFDSALPNRQRLARSTIRCECA